MIPNYILYFTMFLADWNSRIAKYFSLFGAFYVRSVCNWNSFSSASIAFHLLWTLTKEKLWKWKQPQKKNRFKNDNVKTWVYSRDIFFWNQFSSQCADRLGSRASCLQLPIIFSLLKRSRFVDGMQTGRLWTHVEFVTKKNMTQNKTTKQIDTWHCWRIESCYSSL